TEPAGGVTIATLKKLVERGQIARDEVTVAYVTGNGLKAQEAVSDSLDLTIQVEPHVESFEAAVRGLERTPVTV
ncbi:MAG: threonine synthase, partial [Chloroflexota bacterium]|nr:threonine synthase [Chloroflexota bacterium]